MTLFSRSFVWGNFMFFGIGMSTRPWGASGRKDSDAPEQTEMGRFWSANPEFPMISSRALLVTLRMMRHYCWSKRER